MGAECCPKIYALAGGVNLFDFQTTYVTTRDGPRIQLVFNVSFPHGGPAGGLPGGVAMPDLLPAKYGCWAAQQSYTGCTPAAEAVNDASTQLRWGPMSTVTGRC
jgi:hypothetical protein